MASAAPLAINPWDRIPPQRRLLAGGIMALSNFMVVLDLTIANVSVPHIAGNLGVSLDQGTWIITSYAVAEAICVPLTGWIAQRFGTVRVFLAAMAGFGFFSLLCGMSVSLGMLVACRIGQGLCGGPIMPMSQTLLTRVFPPQQRTTAMALWAMTVTAGPAAGPIIGGMISDQISWHWIFFINLPIAVIATLGGLALLKPVETATRQVPIDKVGLGLLVFWIGCLQVMLDIGREHDWFADWRILALAIAAAIGFCVFLIWELTEEHPVVDLRVFRHRGFAATVATQSLCFGAYFSGVVVVPQWMQSSLGYDATKAGIVTSLSAVASVLCAPVAARSMAKIDARILVCIACFWMAMTAFIRARWTSGVDMWSLGWPMFIQGIGVPLMMIPLTSMSLSSVGPEETASAAGLQNFVRTMSIAIATSVVLTIWNDGQITARSEIVNTMQADGLRDQLVKMGLGQQGALAYIGSIVDKEALAIAVDHVFWVAGAFMVAAGLFIWITPRIPLTRMGQKSSGGH